MKFTKESLKAARTFWINTERDVRQDIELISVLDRYLRYSGGILASVAHSIADERTMAQYPALSAQYFEEKAIAKCEEGRAWFPTFLIWINQNIRSVR